MRKVLLINKFQEPAGSLPKHNTSAKLTNGSNTSNCAEWSHDLLRLLGYVVSGDAWKAGARQATILDGFQYTSDLKPEIFSRDAINKYHSATADSLKAHFDPSMLLEWDTINMYYKKSPAAETAYNDGLDNVSSTHTGHIRMVNGIPYVYHEMFGQVKRHKVSDILGGKNNIGITGIYRPTKSRVMSYLYGLF